MEGSSCSNTADKRIRTPNYTTQEKLLLMELVGKYKKIVENKKTDAITWREKDATWNQIAREFNGRTPAGILRDKNSLKKFYENKKKEVRKVVEEDRREMRKTGGGSYIPKYQKDPCYGMLMEITNKKTMLGLNNPFDGDGATEAINKENFSPEDDDPEFMETIIVETEETSFEESHQPDLSIINTSASSSNGTKANWDHYKPVDLKSPPSKPLETRSYASRRRPRVIEPVHTNVISQQYSDVAELKKKYLEQEIAISKRKEERDIEESELRKRALLLDVELKQIQLKRLKTSFD